MDKGTRLIAIIIIFILMTAIAALAWFVWPLPSMNNRRISEKAADRKAESASKAAETTIRDALKAVDRWETLNLDAAAEKSRIRQDTEAHRAYNVNDRRDGDARKIAGDIDTILKKARKNDKDIKASLQGPTGGNEKMRAEKDLKRIARLISGMDELKKDIDVIGHYALSLEAAEHLKAAFADTGSLVGAGRFDEASKSLDVIAAYENETAVWYDMGNQELSNVGETSRDAATILEFISVSRSVSSLYEQVISAGAIGDQSSLENGRAKLDSEMKRLDKISAGSGIDGTFKKWFMKNAIRHAGKL